MRTENETREMLELLWQQLKQVPPTSDAEVLLDQRILAIRWVLQENDTIELNHFAREYYSKQHQFYK